MVDSVPGIPMQGTLVALAALSEGRLADKMKSAALLSPVAYLAHMTTPIGILLAKTFVGEVHMRV
jgi:lysosomal acid lipase/cholesteryl ester hydrolase